MRIGFHAIVILYFNSHTGDLRSQFRRKVGLNMAMVLIAIFTIHTTVLAVWISSPSGVEEATRRAWTALDSLPIALQEYRDCALEDTVRYRG